MSLLTPSDIQHSACKTQGLGVLQIEYLRAKAMSSASSAVTYTSVYTDSELRRVFWGADEELSDDGPPRVIIYGYDGLPMQPVAPPSSDYIPDTRRATDTEVPQVFSVRSSNYLPVDSLLLLSHRVMLLSRIPRGQVEYEDDETEDGSVDYPMDEGDDGDDDDDDSSRDDADDEDEDEEEEEEEHLALAWLQLLLYHLLLVELVSPLREQSPNYTHHPDWNFCYH
ncbi:hypothetical protein Tco_0409421 [Tanacetum coccineum]